MSLDLAERRAVAERMAYVWAIAFYLAEDGTISQRGPGERVEPPPKAYPCPHGHGRARAEGIVP